FQHARTLTILDLPTDLAPELKVVALVVDRPGLIRFHVNAITRVGDQLVEGEWVLPRKIADVGHADHRQPIPSLGTEGCSRTRLANGVRSLARTQIACELAVRDNRCALCRDTFVVKTKRA